MIGFKYDRVNVYIFIKSNFASSIYLLHYPSLRCRFRHRADVSEQFLLCFLGAEPLSRQLRCPPVCECYGCDDFIIRTTIGFLLRSK